MAFAGKLLTTPTRLLKLVLPLPISVAQEESNDSGGGDNARGVSSGETIQPLALLVHPQQPLSYVERLIQAEVPPITVNGKEKIPSVYFRAEDTMGSDNKPTTRGEARARDKQADGTSSRGVGKSGGPTTHVASYSGLGREGPERKRADKSWVRWSSSTEMGDFIRDAARGREFAIEIEGCGDEVRVGVPSFGDRTHYMRVRLRKMSRRIDELARIKHDCDMLAHRGAHRLAKGGFAVLTGWWGVVFFTTFFTDFGWDLVEPVTYLAGLTTIMGGYLWFLYISHDLSYKSAMNVTVSRRQHALYEARGFDLQKWEQLLHDANALRGDIKKVAVEYDVDWDGTSDVSDDVKEVLDKQERKEGRKSETDDDDGSPAPEEDTPEDRKNEKKEEEDTGKPGS